MRILAIETSCDDTGIAVIEASDKKKPDFKVLANIVSSQIEVHKKWGGVYPMLAKREHQKNLVPTLKKALKEAGMPRVDLIAVTNGPGLEPCLWVGVNFAKALADFCGLPIVPVNHIESHILVNFINKVPSLPAICLVVSGGHTQIILMRKIGDYEILGETRDDAAGECFDKTAKILGLEYPGGPAIAAKAADIEISKYRNIELPRPMMNAKDYDFSFSGLKTAVLYDFKKRSVEERKSKEYIEAMCFEVQQAIIDVLIKKTIKAAKDYNVKTIILGGGVSANEELRKQFKEKWEFNLLIPPKNLCTDNGVMTGIAGYYGKTKPWKKIVAEANSVLK